MIIDILDNMTRISLHCLLVISATMVPRQQTKSPLPWNLCCQCKPCSQPRKVGMDSFRLDNSNQEKANEYYKSPLKNHQSPL